MISLKKHYAPLVFLSLFSVATSLTPLPLNAAKRQGTRIAQLEFRDITVSDALKVLSQQSNLNFVASQKAADVHITLYFQSVNPLEVVDAIAKTYNLLYKYDEQTHIIRVYTVDEYQAGKVEFRDEETEIFTMKNSKNTLDLANTISNLYGGRVVLNFDKNQGLLLQDLQERFARFNVMDTRAQILSNLSSGGSSSSSSSGSGNNSNRNNNNSNNNQNNQNNNNNQNNGNNQQNGGNTSSTGGTVTTTVQPNPQNADKPSLIYVSVIKHQNRVLVRTRDAEALSEIKKLYKKLNNESSMMLLEVRILSLNLGDDFNSIFDVKLKGANSAVTSGQSATSALTTALTNAASAFNPSLLATVVSQNFEARLQLLEKENRVTELATPILMTTNQEVSRIFIGEERPITTAFTTSGTTTQVAPNTGTVTTSTFLTSSQILPVTETRSLGTTLLLTPNINADRTVGMNVLIEQSALSPKQASIPLPLGGDIINALVDVVLNKTFTGTVVAKDNTAIAVGGLISENASNNESKVPILGDVPGLGFFFREEGQARGRQELVVIIKPHIISTPDEAADVNQKFLQKNSAHPNTDSLDVYTNPTGEHKDYRLEKPFKEYRGQDVFDKANQKGGANETENAARQISEAQVSTAQQIYVKLTRYAADGVRLPAAQRVLDPKIQAMPLQHQFTQVDLLYNKKIKALPIAAWHQGGIYVTALELHNTANEAVKVDYRHLKGHWLAATIENENLAQQNSVDKSHITHLYLVSSQPFDEQVKTAPY